MTDLNDVTIVGAGHAGCEAALISARMGASTVLVTAQRDSIARMSCNPSIGGIAKSHIVADLDALGGEMARNADFTGIHFRTLNTRKGPAVQATRIQCDKHAYSSRMRAVVESTGNLEIIEDIVTGLWFEDDRLSGVLCRSGRRIRSRTVVLSPGTFLNGMIFIGRKKFPGGRIGEEPAVDLSACLDSLGFRMARLKTGTPPRLHRDSIDYPSLAKQPGQIPPPFISREVRRGYSMFHVEQKESALNEGEALFHVEQGSSPFVPWQPGSNQLCCHLTHTTAETGRIVIGNLSESSLYGGLITGTGVRYCPSIEDKFVKFPNHESHHIFIEPEGRNAIEVYPNGTSNSLPDHVQIEMIRSIQGLSRAEILRPGYAIEYDFLDPTQLTASLESKKIECLFMAGQLNGTTGYEEAAGQGFMAGVNAVLKARSEQPMVFSRSDSYIGVLIDDLVTKGTNEPYRMFTSRAEHRLILRQDNGAFRLLPQTERIGCVTAARISEIKHEAELVHAEILRLKSTFCDGASLAQILCRNEMRYHILPQRDPSLSQELALQVEIEVKYEGYIEREKKLIAQRSRQDDVIIPANISYDEIKALRFESREKLKKIRPCCLGQAARISGVNPSDIAILAIHINRMNSHN